MGLHVVINMKLHYRLYGDYESLSTGFAADALVDFTGGVAEKIQLDSVQSEEEKYNLFNDLRETSENRALITCHAKVSMQCYIWCKILQIGGSE